MKVVQFAQGSTEWHAHRAQHFNASDAPAMLGCSPYKTRAQLLRECATGVTPDIDDSTQRRFDDGHRAEARARPLAEAIVGEDLYPCVGVQDDGKLSASFDGLTLLGDVAYEHKSLNDALRAAMVEGCIGADLPKVYRVQMEQQCLVSGAERVLFQASKWNGDELVEERHCWYTPDPALREEILAGWKQFDLDLLTYTAPAPAQKAVGSTPDQLPALSVVARGMVEFSNLAEFREQAMAAIASVNRDLKTDDDFATAENTVKAFKAGEERLAATKQQVLGQMADVDAVMRTIDEISAEMRRVRLDLDKRVSAEKEARKAELVRDAALAVREHFDTINASLGEHRIQPPQSLQLELAGAIKGKKSLSSMADALHAAAANAKIAASQQAERVRANVAILAEHPDHASLFADRVQLCATKAPDDLRNLVAARVAEHQQREAERLEQERARIRQEEQDRIEREQAAAARAAEAAAAPAPVEAAPPAVEQLATAAAPRAVSAAPAPAAPPPDRKVKLGEINGWIAPLSITADGLATLGFRPVGSQGAAKLYAANDFPAICAALSETVRNAPLRAAEQAAA